MQVALGYVNPTQPEPIASQIVRQSLAEFDYDELDVTLTAWPTYSSAQFTYHDVPSGSIIF